MHEATRQFYLSALGIDVWEARYPLPGAAPSVAREIEEAPGPVPGTVPEAAGADPGPAPVQNLDQIRSVLDDEVETGDLSAESEHSTLPVQEQASHPDSTITLHAAFWHGHRVSLVADLGENAGSEIQLRLGAAIMQALGDAGTTSEVLKWPAFENRTLPGNDDAAFERLVQGMASPSPSSVWLVLGPESIETLSPRLRGQGHEVRLASELTLGRLVADPGAKRQLWETIRHSGLYSGSGQDNGK